jgi:hypothetical protein
MIQQQVSSEVARPEIDQKKKEFHYQDSVLWHYRSGNRTLPIPAVVVCQETDKVIIRARVEGKVGEFVVDPEELTER